MSGIKNSRISVVKETDLGLYVWQMPNGQIVTNENRDIMNIPAFRGDLIAIAKISEAAKKYGITEGSPYFMEGVRRITDEEYQEQLERMKAGYIPDPYDIGVYKDSLNDGTK